MLQCRHCTAIQSRLPIPVPLLRQDCASKSSSVDNVEISKRCLGTRCSQADAKVCDMEGERKVSRGQRVLRTLQAQGVVTWTSPQTEFGILDRGRDLKPWTDQKPCLTTENSNPNHGQRSLHRCIPSGNQASLSGSS